MGLCRWLDLLEMLKRGSLGVIVKVCSILAVYNEC